MRPHFRLNAPGLKPRRQQLRNLAPDTERAIWSKLRKSQLGEKFRRQYSADGYVVDFYCPRIRLAIEIDGRQHQSAISKKYDNYRDRYLQAFNIKTLRFNNTEVVNDISLVIDRIKLSLPLLD